MIDDEGDDVQHDEHDVEDREDLAEDPAGLDLRLVAVVGARGGDLPRALLPMNQAIGAQMPTKMPTMPSTRIDGALRVLLRGRAVRAGRTGRRLRTGRLARLVLLLAVGLRRRVLLTGGLGLLVRLGGYAGLLGCSYGFALGWLVRVLGFGSYGLLDGQIVP